MVFGGHREGAGWRADCPLCHSARALSWKVKGARVKWWSFCASHDEDAMRPILAERLPDCVGAGKRPPDVVPRNELEQLLGLTGAALQLRLACLAWDVPPKVAAEKLGMPGRTYRRAVTMLAKSGRESQVSIAAKNGQVIHHPQWPDLARNPRSQPHEAQTRAT